MQDNQDKEIKKDEVHTEYKRTKEIPVEAKSALGPSQPHTEWELGNVPEVKRPRR
jgi:hypothetical protein